MSKGVMTIITCDNTVTHMPLDHVPSLQELQAQVGGCIERVPYFDTYNRAPCVAYCNEEGKLEGLPMNVVATALWYESIDAVIGDTLVGNVVILTGDHEFRGEE